MSRLLLICLCIVFLGAASLVVLRVALELVRVERQLQRIGTMLHPTNPHRTAP